MNVHSVEWAVWSGGLVLAKKRVEEAERRQGILNAALELFASIGYDGTPVPRIAERAGVGAGTIYRYFENKEALVNALYRHWKGVFFETLAGDFDPTSPAQRNFFGLVRAMARFAREHPKAFAFLEFQYHAPYLDETSREFVARSMAPIDAFLVSAMEQGELRASEPALIASFVFGAYIGLVKAERAGAIVLDEAEVERVARAFWNAFACRPNREQTDGP